MLRETTSAGWIRAGFLNKRHSFSDGKKRSTLRYTTPELEALLFETVDTPVLVLAYGERQYWLFKNRTDWDDEGLAPEDVEALVAEKERRRAQRLERAHHALKTQNQPREMRRGPIPRALRKAVWERDGGACVDCGSKFDLQWDHVLPFSKGGATNEANICVRCSACNLAKSDEI